MSRLKQQCSKRFADLLTGLLLLALSACGRHTCCPAIVDSGSVQETACHIPFLTGTYRWVHSIEGVLPDKQRLSVIGVTMMNSESRFIHCVIMTIEGFVLFDAELDTILTIHRGIHPFDSKSFAKGMIDDVTLMFFKPEQEAVQTGWMKSGESICRYQDTRQITTDIVVQQPYRWEIHRYDSNLKINRVVKGFFDTPESIQTKIPNKIELDAYGEFPYSLMMTLITYEYM